MGVRADTGPGAESLIYNVPLRAEQPRGAKQQARGGGNMAGWMDLTLPTCRR
jgi:hypothetical protein